MVHVVEIRKEQMQVSVISSEEEVQLHATEVLIPNQSVISWSDAYRFNHEMSQGGVSNGTKQIPPSKVVLLMAGSCAAVGTRIQIVESTGMLDRVI